MPRRVARRSPAAHSRRCHTKLVSKALSEAWRAALDITEHDVAGYTPTTDDLAVGEALLAGANSPDLMAEYTGLSRPRIAAVLGTPVAMGWISGALKQHISHRLGMVDVALFHRAINGEVSAAKLLYERLGRLNQTVDHNHHYSGSVDLRSLTTEDLVKMVAEERKVIDVRTIRPGKTVPAPERTEPQEEGSPTALLPAGDQTSEAAGVP